jgi:hypothetical protein
VRVLRASFKADETTVVTSDEFDALDLLSQLDILKDLIYDLRTIYSDKKMQYALTFPKPARQELITKRAKERALLALEYRKKGWTYKTIGVAMYVSASRAQQLVRRGQQIAGRNGTE